MHCSCRFLTVNSFIVFVGCVRIQNFHLKYSDKLHTFFSSVGFTSSKLNCATNCQKKRHCHSFQYNNITGRCVTHPVSFEGRWGFEAREQVGNRVYFKDNSHALGSRCRSNANCYVINSTCYDGACACIPGYSYHQTNYTCVKGCVVYGVEMTVYPGLGISGHNQRMIYDVQTIDGCVTSCVVESSFLCISIDYNPRMKRCALQTVGYLDVQTDEQLRGHSTLISGTRDCAP